MEKKKKRDIGGVDEKSSGNVGAIGSISDTHGEDDDGGNKGIIVADGTDFQIVISRLDDGLITDLQVLNIDSFSLLSSTVSSSPILFQRKIKDREEKEK